MNLPMIELGVPAMGGIANPDPPAGPISWGLDGLSWMLMRLHDLLITAGVPAGTGGVWLVTILLFPVLLRTLLLPLFIQQIRGAARLSTIQKELAQIKEDAAGDRERMHQEMTQVYARENISPFASCLPLVIQLPVYSGVFWVLHAASTKTPRGASMTFHDAWNLSYTPFFGEYLSSQGWQALTWGTTEQILHATIIAGAVAALTWLSMVTRVRMPGVPAPTPNRTRTVLRVVLPLIIFVFAFIMPVAVVLFGASTRIVVWFQRLVLVLIMRRRAATKTTSTDPDPEPVPVTDTTEDPEVRPARPVADLPQPGTQEEQAQQAARADSTPDPATSGQAPD